MVPEGEQLAWFARDWIRQTQGDKATICASNARLDSETEVDVFATMEREGKETLFVGSAKGWANRHFETLGKTLADFRFLLDAFGNEAGDPESDLSGPATEILAVPRRFLLISPDFTEADRELVAWLEFRDGQGRV